MNKVTRPHDALVSIEKRVKENSTSQKAADRSRRNFLKLNLMGLALVPGAGLLLSEKAWAIKRDNGIPATLDADDPQAQALEYTVVTPKSEQSCANCQLYTGAEGKAWGPCALFSHRRDTRTGKSLLVKADGWCRGWAPRRG